MTAISVQGLTKVFRTRKGEVRAVDGVSFTVKEGRYSGFWGRTGLERPPPCGCSPPSLHLPQGGRRSWATT